MTTISPYSAIADATRRAILDLLRDEGTQTAGGIAARFTTMSRPAISKHLRVLREANLVHAEERGREWHYTLHAAPLRPVYQEWLARYEPFWRDTLHRLKVHVEAHPDD